VIVMQRLAALEKVLLAGDAGQPGFVSVIKNQGRLVGGSLAHSHQQIGLSNVMPRRVQEHRRFQQERGEPFSAYLLRVNSQRLQLRDYGPAVLLVPYFMRRPLEMLLLIKDTHKQYLHELSRAEIAAAAEGWHEAIRAICHLMPDMGRETAYNVITHTGPGAGLYFEFLPYTQEIGGYEQLGLYICQGNPLDTAARLREFLSPPA
jgi:galactose-1-phosphate uridylyltransferase